MMKMFAAHFDRKYHKRHDICRETLYKNRLKKSLFIVLGLIGCFFTNLMVYYFHYEHQVPLLILLDIMNVVVTVYFLAGLFFLPYHPTHYGLNTNRLRENLITGLGGGLALALIVVLLRWYLVSRGQKEFGFYPGLKFSYIIYPVFVLAQEMVLKGYFQSYFIALFENNRYARLTAIVISAFVFGQFHLILGIPVFLFTFVYGVLTGLIYERTRSILGVSLLHFFGGFTLLNFSNFYA